MQKSESDNYRNWPQNCNPGGLSIRPKIPEIPGEELNEILLFI